MFNKMNIGPRLLTLIVVQIMILIVLAAVAIFSLKSTADSSEQLRRSIDQNTRLSWMADSIQGGVFPTVHGVVDGVLEWQQARNQLAVTQDEFNETWEKFYVDLDDAEREFVDEVITSELAGMRRAFDSLQGLFLQEDTLELRMYMFNELHDGTDPLLNALLASNAEQQLIAEQIVKTTESHNVRFLTIMGALALAGFLLAALLGFAVYRSIKKPVSQLSATVAGVAAGNFDMRSNMKGSDDISKLGGAFDDLLDDRLAALRKAEQENDALNDSVFGLLEAVSTLSERDLTVEAPVTADIAGPVADAINNMTEQTANVLSDVNRIANSVGSAANSVDEKANAVSEVAKAQSEEIESTATQLAEVSVKMLEIAQLSERCNVAASVASGTTNEAMQTVNNTLTGMSEIRETIQETGKRMKRLGERSNEITEVVDIINTIAERTHVLALNASMQAASAGEAGRGFAVVADEVQRLAESARESTAQISSLVRNIQIDTNDTISTMDRTISHVVDGTRLAEEAGKQMVQTRDATQELVESVAQIAATSKDQATISETIRDRASAVVKRTRSTVDELVEQLKQTRKLVGYSDNLVSSVGMFKLPKKDAEALDQ